MRGFADPADRTRGPDLPAIGAAPERTQASFYRTATGVEIDLVLDLPGNRRWAVEIKRGLAPKIEKGFRTALEDLQPKKAFLVGSGDDRYPKGDGIEVIGLHALADELFDLTS